MNRILILMLLSVFAFATLADKSKRLKVYKKEKKSLSIKLNEVAKKILVENSKIKKLKKKIKKLSTNIDLQEKTESKKLDKLKTLTISVDKTTNEQLKIQETLNSLIAKKFSISIIKKDSKTPDAKALVEESVLSVMQKMIESKFENLKNRFLSNKKLMTNQLKEMERIQSNIKSLKKERLTLTTLKESHDNSLALFSTQKRAYDAEILKISKEQDAIRATLRKLNIIQNVAIPSRKATPTLAHIKNIKVRKIGSSYRVSKSKRYRGKKTISPINGYKIIRKFGTYHDPVYKIKLFSESVKLRANRADAKVRSVFAGKIVYAQSTKVLGKVVIIKTNKMNIIYGHLSQIPSNIVVGKIVKKGSVIGRVKKDLIFEVTNKNVHINPLELIL